MASVDEVDLTEIVQARCRNRLLRQLDAESFALLAPDLQYIDTPMGMPLFAPDQPASFALFPESGVGSLIAISPEGHRVEAGLFGRDGFAPTVLAMGDDRPPYLGTMQVPGAGYRIAVAPFCAAVEANAALRGLLHRFVHVLSVQSSFTALSNAVHPIEERLARWILMCDDRTDSGELRLTHEFMSIMLAVRRPSVTTALHALEGNGLIRAERGLVIIRDRAALEEFAGDAYGKPEREYERLLGPFR